MTNDISLPNINDCTITIFGLGYVGLPLAIEFSKIKKLDNNYINHKVNGFDINKQRIEELKNNYDKTKEVSEEDLNSSINLHLTSNIEDLYLSDVFIITVPTPVDDGNIPDLSAVKEASNLVGKCIFERRKIQLNKNQKETNPIIIYESTVYPGATRDVCIPCIERISGLKNNIDFFYGYSPERVNPGDKTKSLPSITKVTSGSSILSSRWIDNLYKQIISAGTFIATSIEVAEAAKIIENVQRDINIALINELAIIFSKLNLDTYDILEASKTKWNFIYFEPGLVGGHCIGVDPYYLTYKSKLAGYYPEIVSSGRRINENMSNWIAEKLVLNICKNNFILNESHILILGITFKLNCPDIRNSKVFNVIDKLLEYNLKVDVVDPYVDEMDINNSNKFNFHKSIPSNKKYSCVLLAVNHDYFKNLSINDWESLIIKNGFFFDIKNAIPRKLNPIRI